MNDPEDCFRKLHEDFVLVPLDKADNNILLRAPASPQFNSTNQHKHFIGSRVRFEEKFIVFLILLFFVVFLVVYDCNLLGVV